MATRLDPAQLRRLLARTLSVALGGGPCPAQLVARWAEADAPFGAWSAALAWDGIAATEGWALDALDLRTVVPPDVDDLATTAYAEARTEAVRFVADLELLGETLHSAGVPAVALKGAAFLVSNLVPALGARSMSDIDVLIQSDHADRAADALERRGFTPLPDAGPRAPAAFRPYHVSLASPDGRVVELHLRLGPSRWGSAADPSGWFERAAPSATAGLSTPAPADLFWHMVLHDARNHAWSSGTLRAAFDLALVARAPGFDLHEALERVTADPQHDALVEAVADAAHLSPILAAELEPSPGPRYLRLARWRDFFGQRRWPLHRVSEAMAWGATLDRVRRFGGWAGVLDRALRVIPEAVPGTGPLAWLAKAWLNARHSAFIGALGAAHLFSIPLPPAPPRRRRLRSTIA